MTVSCEGNDIATLSTMNLAIGKSVGDETIHGNDLAIFILVLILAGVALYFWAKDLSYLVSAGVSFLCLILLIILKAGISQKVPKGAGQDLFSLSVTVKYRVGYYLQFLSMLALTALNGYVVGKEGVLKQLKSRHSK